jgi:hypothetical protein
VALLGDQVDSGVGRPRVRPFAPEPDPSKLAPVLGSAPQVSLAEALKLAPADVGAGVESLEEVGEGRHDDEPNQPVVRCTDAPIRVALT